MGNGSSPEGNAGRTGTYACRNKPAFITTSLDKMKEILAFITTSAVVYCYVDLKLPAFGVDEAGLDDGFADEVEGCFFAFVGKHFQKNEQERLRIGVHG